MERYEGLRGRDRMLHYFNLSHYLTLILPILLHGSVPSQRLNQLIVQGISNTLDAVSKAIRNDERATTNQRVPIDKSTPTNSHADTSSPRPASDTSPPLSPSIIPPSLVSNQVTPTMTIQSFDMDFDIDPNNNSNNNKPAKPSPSESQRQRQTPPQRPRSRRTDLITRNQRASQQKQQQQQQQRMLRERYNSVSQHRYYHWVAVGVPLMENKWANVITPTLVLALLPEPQRPFLPFFPNPTFGLLGPSTNPPNTPSSSSSSTLSFPFTPTQKTRDVVQIDQKRVTSLRADARSLMNKMKSCEDYELKDIPTKWAYSMPTLTMTRTMPSAFTPMMTSSTATSSDNKRQRQQQRQRPGQFDGKEREDKTSPPSSSPSQPPSSPSSTDDHSNLFQPLVQPLSLISSSGQRIRLHRCWPPLSLPYNITLKPCLWSLVPYLSTLRRINKYILFHSEILNAQWM